MCAIVGVYGEGPLEGEFDRLYRSLAHRGPDATGKVVDSRLRMGMHRLKFRGPDCDLPPGGPGAVSAYNGQVYGHFEGDGQYAAVAEDLLAELGVATQQPLADGMFAYAHYAPALERVALATDAHFIKPLFYRRDGQSVAFASEMAPLLAIRSGLVDIDALAELFAYGWYLGDRSCVADLSLVWRHDVVIDREEGLLLYPKLAQLAPASVCPSPAQLRAAIRDSVARSIQGAGPLGLALSGGLDSNILAWELSALGVEDLICVTVQTVDGGDGVASLAELGLPPGEAWERWRHVVVRVDDNDFLHAFEESVRRFGQPTTMSSLPLYQRLADAAAAAGVRALLLGEGVDEFFAGYASYGKVSALPSPLDYYRHAVRERLVLTLFGPERFASVQRRFARRYRGTTDLRVPEAQLRLTRLLLRSDVCLMSRSIEGRVPFLHNGIPSMALAIPWDVLAAVPGKALLREAYASRLGARATRAKVRFKSSDAMLLRCLDLEQLEPRIVAACSPLFGQGAIERAITVMRGADGFDADILCLLMSLTFLFESGLLHDDAAIPTRTRALHA